MVTIHHEQSKLTPSMIAVIPSQQLTQKESVLRNFEVSGTKFSKILNPSPTIQSLAKALILEGQSAALFDKRFENPAGFFFDMDATVIAEESLVEIAKALGKESEIESLTTQAMAGGMDFKKSLHLRLSLLKGMTKADVLSVQTKLNPGITDLLAWIHREKIPVFLVSGGFQELAAPIAKSLKFVDYRANQFAWDGEQMLGYPLEPIVDGEGKKSAVQQWCEQYHLVPQRCVAVGDGANDLPMMKYVGLAVGHSPKKALWPHLHISNHTGNHVFVNYCLQNS